MTKNKKTILMFPDLISEFHPSKNEGIDVQNLSYGSNIKVWWIGKCGHEWNASPHNRLKGSGCPFCSGRRVKKGFNDLKTTNPEIIKEWDFEKNTVKPTEISCGSNKKVWWKCNKGHSWLASISHRTNGEKCPICSNKKNETGINDLTTIAPILVKEWDFEKNTVKPTEISCGSNKKVWWVCKNGHGSYLQSIINRMHGSGCPICNSIFQTSFPEQAIYYYVKKAFSDALNKNKSIFNNNMELDIYIPSKKIGIEYDGINWHNSKIAIEREKRKYELCKKSNIFLYRIKEECNNLDNADKVFTIPKFSIRNPKYLENVISLIIKDLLPTNNIKVNFINDFYEINKYRIIKYENSLAFLYPNIAKEWYQKLNKSLKPENVTPGTSIKVWWKCEKCGNIWQSSVLSRTKGHGCNICANEDRKVTYHNTRLKTRKLLVGNNYLLDWDYTKNFNPPEFYTKGSGEKVWWKCHKCGHEWKTSICDRTREYKNGCPACSNRILVKGKNDLLTTNPELIKEWDWQKNENLKPSEIAQWSHEKVWWKCHKCGHSYQATPSNRVFGKGCPCCCGRVVVSGINDLATTSHDIAIDWHPNKNFPLKPSDVTKGRKDKIWWKCHICGYEWEDSLNHRSRGRGCPKCRKNIK